MVKISKLNNKKMEFNKEGRKYECVYHHDATRCRPGSFHLDLDGHTVAIINQDQAMSDLDMYNLDIYNAHKDLIHGESGNFNTCLELLCEYFKIDHDKIFEFVKS